MSFFIEDNYILINNTKISVSASKTPNYLLDIIIKNNNNEIVISIKDAIEAYKVLNDLINILKNFIHPEG